MELDPKSKYILNVIFNFNLKVNVYEALENLIDFCFSYCAFSHRNLFKIYIQYKDFYTCLFPTHLLDFEMILNTKYQEIHEIIHKKLEEFFSSLDHLEYIMETTSISENQKGTNDEDVHMQDLTKPNENGDALDKSRNNDVISNNDLKENKFISVASNKIYLSTSQIMTKILLENNHCAKKYEDSKSSKNTNDLNNLKSTSRHRLLIFSDLPINEKYLIDQKLLFLFKTQNISIDVITINEKPSSIFKSITNFTNGHYYNIENIKHLNQLLLQKYLLNCQDRRKPKFDATENIYSKSINCNTCNGYPEKFVFIVETKEIACEKCFREKKNNKN